MRTKATFGVGVVILVALLSIIAAVIWAQIQASQQAASDDIRQPQMVARSVPTPKIAYLSSPLCIGGCPTGAKSTDQIVTHHILILANNPDTKFADWVAYRITPDVLGSHCKRRWEADPDIDPANTLSPRDYTGIRETLQSDRGHQAPLASVCGSPYWQEADYLSNITPQRTNLNEGAWEKLEDAERSLVSSGQASAVYSVTGTLYERAMPALPRAHVSEIVPSGYWKVIAIEKDGSVATAGFVMDQTTPRNADYCAERVSLAALETRTKLHLFPGLANAAVADGGLFEALGCR